MRYFLTLAKFWRSSPSLSAYWAAVLLPFWIWLLAEPSQAAQIACTPTSGFSVCYQYTYSGADQTIAIPSGITSIDTRVFGAAGGGANSSWWQYQGGGAGGGYAKGTVAVSGGPTLTVVVGQGGIPNSTAAGYGGGGPGGGSNAAATIGGSGGGMSGVFSSSTKTAATALVISGGGGGGSPGADVVNGGPGGGGGTTGGQDSVPVSSGRGGTASAGGAAATGTSSCSPAQTAGAQFNGGNGGTTSAGNHEGGGGGGGGYYGGGGGLCQGGATQNGSGGGGSSFTGGTGVTAGTTTAGSNFIYSGAVCSGNSTSGGAADSLYTAGIGVGSCYGTGGNGLVTIQYAMPTVTLTKISLGGVGGFTFTGTNGWSSQTITTVTAGTAVVGAKQALAAISTATTITETPAAGFVATALSCTGLGSSGTATLSGNTISLNAAAAAEGANIACTITNTKLPTLTLTKISNGAVGGFTFTGSNGWTSQTITTVTSGTGVAGATQTLTAAATSTTITETIPTGYTVTSIACSSTGGGAYAPTLATGTVVLNTVATAAGAVITCTFTNTKTPTFKVQVTSQAGSGGPVRFGQTNLATTPADIIPTALNILEPSSPTAIDISAIGTAVTLSQVIDFRYDVVGATCSDANSAITGNTGTFSSLSGPLGFETVTIPAANVLAGANFTCVLTVKRITRLLIYSATLGGVGTTGFALPTNQPSQNITTATPGVAVVGLVGYFTSIGVAGTITVTPISGYTLTGVTCTDTDVNGPWGTGSISTNFLAGTFTFPATMVVYGANYSCTATTSKTPTFKLQKITSGGFGGPFTFTQTNLASTPSSISTTAAATATPAAPTAINVSTIGTAITVTEASAVGFFFSTASCTDTNSAITNNTGSFGTVTGSQLTVPSSNVVAGADFVCVFSNTKGAPQLTILKSADTAGPVDVGTTITYTYTVKNIGNVAMTGITVSDLHNGSGVFSGPSSETIVTDIAPTGDTTDSAINGNWDQIGAGDTVKFTATYVVTQNDIDTLQ